MSDATRAILRQQLADRKLSNEQIAFQLIGSSRASTDDGSSGILFDKMKASLVELLDILRPLEK